MQEADGAVQMLKLQGLEALAFNRLQPLAALQIAAGLTQPLQRQGESGPLHIKLEPSLG